MANKVVSFVREVEAELKKVSWSNRQELVSSTIVVIVSTLLLALFIGFCDFVLSNAVGVLLG